MAGQAVDLTPTEFHVTCRRPARPAFTRAELIERALGYTYEGIYRTVDSHIKNLRRKIEPDPANPIFIQTVYGVGIASKGRSLMNCLSARLTLAIVATTLLAVGRVGLIANRTAGSEFRRYLASGQMAGSEELATASRGVRTKRKLGWYRRPLEGVAVVPGCNMNGRGQGGRGAARGMAAMQVADAAGQVVYDSQGASLGKQLTRSQREAAVPIVVGEDRVGYLLVLPPGQMQLAGAEQAFLDRINRAFVASAAVALLVGVLLGVLLARTLAAPLGRVAAAAEAIAGGDLAQRVPEQGTEEICGSPLFRPDGCQPGAGQQLRRNLWLTWHTSYAHR